MSTKKNDILGEWETGTKNEGTKKKSMRRCV